MNPFQYWLIVRFAQHRTNDMPFYDIIDKCFFFKLNAFERKCITTKRIF